MRRTVLGERTGPKYYADLRQGWRMGDFAGLRMLIDSWRRAYPEAHVTVTYGNHHWRSVHANQLDIPWIFRGVADVVLEMEHENDLIHNPIAMDGKPLVGGEFSCHIWNDWARLRSAVVSGKVTLQPHLPDEDVLANARKILDKKGVPEKFVTVHPLFDAGYNKYRNGKPEWWSQLIAEMAKHLPVVVVGMHAYGKYIAVPDNAFQLFDLGLPAMASLGVVAQSQMHVGGETGLTLWAGVCDVPVLATYGRWGSFRDSGKKLADFRPIPFSKPVVHAPLNGSVIAIAKTAVNLTNDPGMPAPPPAAAKAPSVKKLATPKPPPPKRIVRAPRAKTPARPARDPNRPRKTLKQLLAERRARK